MVAIAVILIYIIFFISMICALSTAIRLYLSGTNYLIAVLSGAMALGELISLSSIIWIDDFQKKVPKTYCVFQGLALQYAVYLQIVAAVCFSFHIYQLLVRYKPGMTPTLQKAYISFIISAPIIMTIIAAIASIKTDAIKPLAINCDIKSPTWVRLIGYSGFNFILTFPGVYLSTHAAIKVFRHLDQFKTTLTSIGGNSGDSQSSETRININNYNSSRLTIQVSQSQIKSYNMTKAAAIRMVLFSCGFALINVLAAFQTIRTVLAGGFFGHGEEEETSGIGGNDLAGGFMGLMIFLVFGLPSNVRRFFTHRRRGRNLN